MGATGGGPSPSTPPVRVPGPFLQQSFRAGRQFNYMELTNESAAPGLAPGHAPCPAGTPPVPRAPLSPTLPLIDLQSEPAPVAVATLPSPSASLLDTSIAEPCQLVPLSEQQSTDPFHVSGEARLVPPVPPRFYANVETQQAAAAWTPIRNIPVVCDTPPPTPPKSAAAAAAAVAPSAVHYANQGGGERTATAGPAFDWIGVAVAKDFAGVRSTDELYDTPPPSGDGASRHYKNVSRGVPALPPRAARRAPPAENHYCNLPVSTYSNVPSVDGRSDLYSDVPSVSVSARASMYSDVCIVGGGAPSCGGEASLGTPPAGHACILPVKGPDGEQTSYTHYWLLAGRRPDAPAGAAPPPPASAGAVQSSVAALEALVHGVTADECHAALAASGWQRDDAERYLKLEQLFRLGLADRDRCRRLLNTFHWDLQLAGSVLLDGLATGSAV